MSLTSLLSAGRRATERLLIDTCTIGRPGAGAGTMNEGTGAITTPARTAVYSGRCRLRQRAGGASGDVEAGEQEVSLRDYLLEIPWDSTSPEVNDVATVTASDDTHAVGRELRVTQVHHSSTLLVRRMTVEDVDDA
ncbi:DUF6093 family protein [Iamia sp.]|uniref:DUF6093 family protein n=1 Tax=Iamia sp. TaxID=2722710 RepID=UPI002C86638C|nr:DUF6093 family protein [Iamia sp.]HXH57728.1 DUF6093 family protein [Iamia sp.]